MMSGLSPRPVMVGAIGLMSDPDEQVAMDTACGEVCRNPRASVPPRGDSQHSVSGASGPEIWGVGGPPGVGPCSRPANRLVEFRVMLVSVLKAGVGCFRPKRAARTLVSCSPELVGAGVIWQARGCIRLFVGSA